MTMSAGFRLQAYIGADPGFNKRSKLSRPAVPLPSVSAMGLPVCHMLLAYRPLLLDRSNDEDGMLQFSILMPYVSRT